MLWIILTKWLRNVDSSAFPSYPQLECKWRCYLFYPLTWLSKKCLYACRLITLFSALNYYFAFLMPKLGRMSWGTRARRFLKDSWLRITSTWSFKMYKVYFCCFLPIGCFWKNESLPGSVTWMFIMKTGCGLFISVSKWSRLEGTVHRH